MRLTAPTPVDLLSLETDVTDLKVFVRSMTFTSAAGTCIHKDMNDETLLEELANRTRTLIQILNSGQVTRISNHDEALARGKPVQRTEEYESLIVRDLDLPPFKGTVEDFERAMSGAQPEKRSNSVMVPYEEATGDPPTHFRGRIVGNAQLRFRSQDWVDRLPVETSNSAPRKGPTGMNMELALIFERGYKQLELSCMKGKAYYYVDEMGTVASHSGRGIGRSLMQWMFDHADRDGVPIFIISSPLGLPFYLKLGFEEVGPGAVMDVDLRPYGGSTVYRHTAVIRQPNRGD